MATDPISDLFDQVIRYQRTMAAPDGETRRAVDALARLRREMRRMLAVMATATLALENYLDELDQLDGLRPNPTEEPF